MTEIEFEELYARHFRALCGFVVACHGRRYLDPEHVVQDTFVRLVKTGAYRGMFHQGVTPRAPVWLVRAVDFTARDSRRRQLALLRREKRDFDNRLWRGETHLGTRFEILTTRAEGEVVVEIAVPSCEHDVEVRLTADRALNILGQVDILAREAALLVHVDGLTWREAAKGLGTGTADALRVRVARAFRQVRERMSDTVPAQEKLQPRVRFGASAAPTRVGAAPATGAGCSSTQRASRRNRMKPGADQ